METSQHVAGREITPLLACAHLVVGWARSVEYAMETYRERYDPRRVSIPQGEAIVALLRTLRPHRPAVRRLLEQMETWLGNLRERYERPQEEEFDVASLLAEDSSPVWTM